MGFVWVEVAGSYAIDIVSLCPIRDWDWRQMKFQVSGFGGRVRDLSEAVSLTGPNLGFGASGFRV